MNKEVRKVPRIRFKGFNDDWEQRKFNSFIKLVGGATPSKSNPEYWNGDIVWLSSQEIKSKYISRGTYTISDKAVIDKKTKVVPSGTPIIVTRSGILAKRFPLSIATEKVAINQDLKALLYDNSKYNTDYLVAEMQSKEKFILNHIVKNGTTVQSVNLPDLEKMIMSLPNLIEQKRIGSFFFKLDKNIALHQRKLDLLKKQKEYFLKEMFPSKVSDLPNIRFKGFTDEWEQCKFGDILISNPFRAWLAAPQSQGTYKVIQQGNMPILGYADGIPFKNFEDVTLFGDHTVSLYKPQAPFFTATDGIKILSAKNIYGNFLYTLLERYKPDSEGYKRHFSILKNQKIFFTQNTNEQIAIGVFFLQLDKVISLNQRELLQIKKIKHILLQNLFV